ERGGLGVAVAGDTPFEELRRQSLAPKRLCLARQQLVTKVRDRDDTEQGHRASAWLNAGLLYARCGSCSAGNFDIEEVGQQRMAVLGEDALGMELHAPHRMLYVTHAHHHTFTVL